MGLGLCRYSNSIHCLTAILLYNLRSLQIPWHLTLDSGASSQDTSKTQLT